MCLRGRVCACGDTNVLRGPRGLGSLVELGLQAVARSLMWVLEATRNWVWFLCKSSKSSVSCHSPTHLSRPSRKFYVSLPRCVIWECCPISSHPWLILSASGSCDSKQQNKANLVKSRERLAWRWCSPRPLALVEQILLLSPSAKAGSALRSRITQRQNSQRNNGNG